MNGSNKQLARKIIKKYQKELHLQEWSFDLEFNNQVKTSFYIGFKKKEALLVINKRDYTTLQKLNTLIKYQIIGIKEKIVLHEKKHT